MSNKKIEMHKAKNGSILNPAVHDAEITYINIDGDLKSKKSASIGCKSEDGNEFSLIFEGVDFFLLDYFGHQNIISEVYVITNADPTELFNNISSLSSYYSKSLPQLIEEIKRGTLIFINIIPSTGCEISVVCSKVWFDADVNKKQ